jgi:hypothetical protein
VLDGPPLTAPRYLLTWRPAPVLSGGETTTYVAEAQDYYAEPRTLVEHLSSGTGTARPATARIVPGPAVDGTRTAHIEVTHDGTTTRVDLGQALRGHRFARQAPTTEAAPAGEARTADLWDVLRAPGLVWTEAGDVTVDATGQDDLVVLALLGRLYPENVALRHTGRHAGPATADSNRPGRILIDLSDPDVTGRQDSQSKTQ